MDEIQMSFIRIGFEICEENGFMLRFKINRQHPVSERGWDPEPFIAVIGGTGFIIFPAIRIGRISGVEDHDFAFLSRGTCEPEMKPLEKIRLCILPNHEPDDMALFINADHTDIATIEVGTDFHIYGTIRLGKQNKAITLMKVQIPFQQTTSTIRRA